MAAELDQTPPAVSPVAWLHWFGLAERLRGRSTTLTAS